jgi:hypothetical protein
MNLQASDENRGGTRVRIVIIAAAICSLTALLPVAAESESFTPPRSADGRPDFNGIWQTINEANWGLEARAAAAGAITEAGATYALPPSIGVVEGGEIPYQPGARAQRDENFAHRLERDPEVKCYLPGVPRATYMPQPFQIVQGDDHIVIVYQYRGAMRTINMTEHSDPPAPTWMGWSNGRYEGDTLVIETTGFNGLTWLDRSGNFHSDQLRVVERIRHLSADVLEYEATLEDPAVFTGPWTIRMPVYRRLESDLRIMDFKCVEFVEELLYGHLEKPEE